MSSYNYEIDFERIGPDQVEFLKEHFDDYSWDAGLATKEVSFDVLPDGLRAKFESTKYLIVDDDDESEENLYHSLVGKGQFFSAIYSNFINEDVDVDSVRAFLIDDDGTKWNIELSKYSALEKDDVSGDSEKITYVLKDPEGNEYTTDNLKAFCKERDLWPSNLKKVAQGKSKSAQGWTCRFK